MSQGTDNPSGSFCGRTRREFLWEAGAGFTGLALAGLLARDGFFDQRTQAAEAFANPLAPKPPRATPRANQSRAAAMIAS